MGKIIRTSRHPSLIHNAIYLKKIMELPHLGTHCSLASCNRLDYLPFKCKHCVKNFCENHWQVWAARLQQSASFSGGESFRTRTSDRKDGKEKEGKAKSVSAAKLQWVRSGENGLWRVWAEFLCQASVSGGS